MKYIAIHLDYFEEPFITSVVFGKFERPGICIYKRKVQL